MIIVIDGPAGSGKSSTARAVADRMNIEYLDSGALYRAVTWLFLQYEGDFDSFFRMLKPERIEFRYRDGTFHVWADDEEITRKLRTSRVSNRVSQVASKAEIRKFVNDLMHQAVKKRTCIAEGRDLGTAVFPDAAMKFYMTADVSTRARRRYEEMQEEGHDVDFDRVRENIKERDAKDARRDVDPLKKAEDAILIDTSDMTFDQQVDKICEYIESYGI